MSPPSELHTIASVKTKAHSSEESYYKHTSRGGSSGHPIHGLLRQHSEVVLPRAWNAGRLQLGLSKMQLNAMLEHNPKQILSRDKGLTSASS